MKENNSKAITCFQFLIGISTIVGCVAAVIVIPQIQNLFQNPFLPIRTMTKETQTQSIAQVEHTEIVRSTSTGMPPPSILEPGQSWKNDALEIRLFNTNFEPGCDGIVSFSFSIIKLIDNIEPFTLAGLDIIFIDNNKKYYTDIWWQNGVPDTGCYSYQQDGLTINHNSFTYSNRIDLAFRVRGLPINSGGSLFVNIRTVNDYIVASWEIKFP